MNLIERVLVALGILRERTVEDILSPITKIATDLEKLASNSNAEANRKDEEAARLKKEAEEKRNTCVSASQASRKVLALVQ